MALDLTLADLAMKIRVTLIACTMTLLMGCGLADQYSVMPKFLRQPSAEPPSPEPEPDVKELRPVEIHREFMTAAARWMFAAKL